MSTFRRDDVSFEDFVAARAPALARTAYLLTGDAHLAEDLVQSALLKAVHRWGRIDDHEAYLRRVIFTENVSRSRRRRVIEVPLDSDTDPPQPGTGHDDRSAAREEMLAALRQLPSRQRAVIVLRYYEDLTEAQTANALGISIGTVKSQSHLALRRLRELAPHLNEPSPLPTEEVR